MITKITTIEELKRLFFRVFFSKTDKVTKISDNSVINGIGYGVSKIAQKSLKDIALVETHLFPDLAYGENLDIIASRRGVPGRFGMSGSSTFLRIVAEPGTQYQSNIHIFTGQGIEFQLENDIVIGPEGYTYVRARSIQKGRKTNVNSLLIDTVQNEPQGHISVVNEFKAQGGRDKEDDDMFRYRIINYPNLFSRDTLGYIGVIMRKFNNDVLKVYKKGTTSDGKLILGIILQNGSFLSNTQLDDLLDKIKPFLSLTYITSNNLPLVKLENCDYLPIDISLRVQISSSIDLQQLRIDLQDRISKYLDLRFWDTKVVQWEYLLNIVSSHKDVVIVPDQHFYPNSDIVVYTGYFPRVRSFRMYDLEGNLLSENTNSFEPVLYNRKIIFE